MVKIDFTKLTGGKLDLQKLVKDVKLMIGAETPIPVEAKEDPTGYLLSELTKSVKTLQEINMQQSKEIEKLGATLGALYKECMSQVSAGGTSMSKKEETKPEIKTETPKEEIKAETKFEKSPEDKEIK
jgi:hypothetical protein